MRFNFFQNLGWGGHAANAPRNTPAASSSEGKGTISPHINALDMWGMSRVFDERYSSEAKEIEKFRQMATFDIIADVISDAKAEVFPKQDDNRIFRLDFDDDTEFTQAKRDYLAETFEKFQDNFNLSMIMGEYVEEFLIASKLYFEKIKDKKGKVINLRPLPPESMQRVIDLRSGKILRFLQIVKDSTEPITFEPEEILYLSFGKTPYLRYAITLYNKLNILDPSIIIYRFVRAPERLIFKVYVGRMPREKAWAYVNKVKENFKNKLKISSTGEIDTKQVFHSFLSNYWLPITADDRSSNIESIAGGGNLDDLKDWTVFMKRLYKVLKYPLSRAESVVSDSVMSPIFSQRPDSITRDEVKWSKFLIDTIQEPFTISFRNLFYEYLLNLDDSKLKVSEETLKITDILLKPKNPNDFEELRAQEDFEMKLNNYGGMRDFPEFPKIWLLKKVFKLTDEEIDEMIEILKDKRNDLLFPPEAEEEGGGGY